MRSFNFLDYALYPKTFPQLFHKSCGKNGYASLHLSLELFLPRRILANGLPSISPVRKENPFRPEVL
jgi:hypothetical protein